MSDSHHKNEREERIGKLRMSASMRSSFGSSKPAKPPVRITGSYRYHKGSKATKSASGKMNANMRYAAGERKDQIEKGTDKKRELFDANGEKITLEKAEKVHENPFIEHRIIVAPKDANADDLHILSQAAIKRIQSMNPQSEVRATYAVHTDTSHPHAHLLITSQNKLEIRKDDYKEIREESKELLGELYRDRGQEITQKPELKHEQNNEQQHEQIEKSDQPMSLAWRDDHGNILWWRLEPGNFYN